MSINQRIAILVDSENLEINVSDHFEPTGRDKKNHLAYPNWRTIIPDAVRKRELVRLIYYKKRGLRISSKFRRLWEEDLGGEIKQPIKSVDPYIIIDAITLCEKVDVMVLLAGDKDYLPLIWYLRSRGCKVEMASFEEAAAAVLRSTADRFDILNQKHTVIVKKTALFGSSK